MKIKKVNLLLIQLFIFYIFLVYSNKISFKIFPQVQVLLDNKLKLIDLINLRHPHTPRYLVVLPIIILKNIFGGNLTVWNTIYSVILLILSIKFSIMVIEIQNKKSIFNIILIIINIFIISICVNGRFIFAFFGESLLIYLCFYDSKKITLYLISFLYSMVSSGTMMVIIVSTMIFFILNKKVKKIYLILLLPIAKYIYFMTKRNYLYFNKNLYKIFSHGMFNKLYDHTEILVLFFLVFSVLIFIIYAYKYKKNPENKILYILISVSVIFGFFGKTTFYMMLLPIFLQLILEVNIRNNVKKIFEK